MTNTTETRADARDALDLFMNRPGRTGCDEGENIADLIADLAHLADRLHEETDGDLPDGAAVLRTATLNYEVEADEADAEDPALYTITRSDVAWYAGRPLTDEEADRFADSIGNTSLPECITGCLDGMGITSDG